MTNKFVIIFPILFFCIFPFFNLRSENTINGLVLDKKTNKPMQYVNIYIDGSTNGTTSGVDGRFTLKNVTSGPHQLLELIGRDQIQRPGRWTNITYDLDILPQAPRV